MTKIEVRYCIICGQEKEKYHWQKFHQKQSQIEKRKISIAMKQWHKNNKHPMKGRHHSPATKAKMSRRRQGKGNGNWKNGITLSVRNFRKSKQYQRWRKNVLQQDNYQCQDCGTKYNLEVHHIKSVKYYPLLKLMNNNGITLCNVCHRERHKNVA